MIEVTNNRKKLVAILAIGLLLRLGLLFFFWDEPLTIVDEQHYQAIAENILDNNEFALRTGRPTAIRPPFYPAFLSFVYYLTGGVHFNTVRIVQIILSLGIIWMVYVLGKKIFDDKTGLLASLIFAVYPSFLFFTNFLLTEVLFTLLFTIFIFFFIFFIDIVNSKHQNPLFHASCPTPSANTTLPHALSPIHHADPKEGPPSHLRNLSPSIFSLCPMLSALCILCAGFFLGLGALTRSILYPFLMIALIFFAWCCRTTLTKKVKWAFLLFIGFAMVVAPWTARNFLLLKDFVPIGTMGGLNLYMGNYKYTPLNRAWAAVDLNGEKTWYHGHEDELSQMNEAQKQRWTVKQAKEFILNHKLLSIKRTLIKAANFWGLERSVIAGIIHGHWSRLKKTPHLIVVALLIFSMYSLVVIGSVFGTLFNLHLKRYDILFIFTLIIYFTGMHAIVFGHSRYHLPLIPLLAVFASWTARNLKNILENRTAWRFKVSIITSILFFCIWLREIIFVEGARFLSGI